LLLFTGLVIWEVYFRGLTPIWFQADSLS